MSEEVTLDEFADSPDEDNSQEQGTSRFWGKIPGDWRLKHGTEVYEVNPNPKPTEEPNTYIEMDALDTELPWPKYFGTRNASEYSGKTFTKGDTLFARITPCTENGKAALVPEMGTEVGIGSTEYAVLSPKRNIINPWLLYYFSKSHPVHNYAVSRMRGSTGRQRVPFSVFRRELDVALPPLPEQRKIATVLYTVDRVIEKAEAIVDRVERIHKGIFQSLIPAGIGHEQFDDVRILGRNVRIPTNWDVTTVSEACSEIIDYRGKNPKFSDEGIPHLRNINIGRGELLLDDLKYVSEETYDEWMTRGFPQEGDTLLSTEAPMGKTAVLPEMKFSLSQRLIVLRPVERFDNQFFAHLMGSPFVQKEYEARATGSTVKGISNYNLQEVTIPVPPREEQEEIAERIDETLEAIQINEQEIERLNRLKRGLMQDLLSGEVMTTNTNIAVPDEIAQYG